MRQRMASWQAGYNDGRRGSAWKIVGDSISYASGYIEGRARPMFGTIEHLTDWIAQQPADRTFPAAAGIGCLYCQYGNAYGRIASYEEVVRELDFSPAIRDQIVAEPRTFGAALERARSST